MSDDIKIRHLIQLPDGSWVRPEHVDYVATEADEYPDETTFFSTVVRMRNAARHAISAASKAEADALRDNIARLVNSVAEYGS